MSCKGVPAIERAHVNLRGGKFGMNEVDNAACGLRVVGAHRDQPRLARARRAQHIEPGAVAVIDLEPEAGDTLEHLRIVVDGSDVDTFGKQALGDDLAEAPKTDNQYRPARIGEIV